VTTAPPGSQQSSQPPEAYHSPGAWQGARPSASPPTGASGSPFQTASTGPPAAQSPRETIRIASFNIQDFGEAKAAKSYVLAELADIVQQFDLVAIQEVRTQDEYLIPNFVQLVNQRGRRFDHVIGPRLGITTQTEQYVYLYDTQKIEVDRNSVYTLRDPDGLLHREPLIATFRTRGVAPDQAFTFTLVNMHVDPDVAAQEIDVLAEVYRVVRRTGGGEDDIILLGDFSTDAQHLGRLGELPGVLPLIAGVWTNTQQDRQLDHLLLHQPSTSEYTGNSGVFDFMRFKNLSLQQALQVSDHFPVWAEFSIYERDALGRVASRGARR
jgi:endonuclease/exonuclease/phosphatase family metal-dependent hydrolase